MEALFRVFFSLHLVVIFDCESFLLAIYFSIVFIVLAIRFVF